jgi:hypothetical protein
MALRKLFGEESEVKPLGCVWRAVRRLLFLCGGNYSSAENTKQCLDMP